MIKKAKQVSPLSTIRVYQDTLDFIKRWRRKATCYPLERLDHYFDRFFTAYVLYNFLYVEICSQLHPNWANEQEMAAKAVKKLLGARAIFDDAVIRRNGEEIRTLIESKTFYVRDGVWDKNRIEKLATKDPECWVKGLLEIIYGIRCNTFHGSKNFDDCQKVVLAPCIRVIERLNDMIIKNLRAQSR